MTNVKIVCPYLANPVLHPMIALFVKLFNHFCSSGILITLKHTLKHLKVQSCKLHNNKYMIASIQITNTEIFAFIAALVFELLSRKVLFINRKDNRNC